MFNPSKLSTGKIAGVSKEVKPASVPTYTLPVFSSMAMLWIWSDRSGLFFEFNVASNWAPSELNKNNPSLEPTHFWLSGSTAIAFIFCCLTENEVEIFNCGFADVKTVFRFVIIFIKFENQF